MKHLLTIAGSDSSGGAGIQADLKTFAAHGTFGMSVITAVTAQNTCGVMKVQDIDPDIITAQLDAVFGDIAVDAVKIGMVSRSESIRAIAAGLRKWKPAMVVLDPVMVSKSGYDLLHPEACQTLLGELLPLATLVTPNLPEAEKICGFPSRTNRKWNGPAEPSYSSGPGRSSSKEAISRRTAPTITCMTAAAASGFPAGASLLAIRMARAVPCQAPWQRTWRGACPWRKPCGLPRLT